MSTTGEWGRVRQLFHDALEQPADAREAFLAAACPTDDRLRDEVWSLLAAHAAAGPFLELPAARLADSARRQATLGVGARLGRFEITGTLGAGGMGEVYRARDLQLVREVALKILPPVFADSAQRLARFERESRVLASLQHPNIAAIHSIEELDGMHVLVMQLVEGPTLAERVRQGPVPLPETLAIARQLAGALEAAHERGIVHRDLKPANIKLSPSGHVTLLDFGLAKERVAGGESTGDTVDGAILGTWGYMSPEQARGLAVDKRTDIWAFGCILYELLSGRPVFAAERPSDTIAAVLAREPDWSRLPDGLPIRLHRLLRRLLEKDQANRMRDIADVGLELDDLRNGESDEPVPTSRIGPTWQAFVASGVLLTAASLAAGWLVRDRAVTAGETPLARFVWTVPADLALASAPVVSPDGDRLAFAAARSGASTQLYVRRLSELEARPIAGTDGARQPFWSPDGASLGYFARGQMLRVTVDGGVPVAIAPTPGDPKGGTWGRDGTIVFAPAQLENGLWRVPATGGTPQPATSLDIAQGDNAHRWPAFLPDGVQVVYFVRSAVTGRRGVYVSRIDRPEVPGRLLFTSESEAVFGGTDDSGAALLLTASDDHVDVRRFDIERAAIIGDPVRLAVPAGGNSPHHGAALSVSPGVLAAVATPMPYGVQLASVQTSGGGLVIEPGRGIINWPRLSRDGTRLATTRLDPVTGIADLWVEDLARGTRTRVTHERWSAQLPTWSPDGTRLAYVSGFSVPALNITAADGTGEAGALPCPRERCEPTDWSADGRWLVVQTPVGAQSDVWLLPADSDGEARLLLGEAFAERDARLSPDRQLLAYVSEESGQAEVSIRAVLGAPRRIVVSPGGGTQPVWARDGRALLFVDPAGALRRVPVRLGADGGPALGTPELLPVPPIGTGHRSTQYDVSPDQRRVYFIDREPAPGPPEIALVLGWRRLLE